MTPHDEQSPRGSKLSDVGPADALAATRTVRTLEVEQVRAIDRAAIDDLGVPELVLMENAARQLAAIAHGAALAQAGRPTAIWVFTGPGNNGGDGLAAARHLAGVGHAVTIVLAAGEPKSESARVHFAIAQRLGLTIVEGTPADEPPAVVIDAILGTGLRAGERAFEGPAAEATTHINQLGAGGATIIAADVPTGLDAHTGTPLDPCVRADITVTFAARKAGFDTPTAAAVLGRVVMADIGVPDAIGDTVSNQTD